MNDTIASIITPLGTGAVGLIRISGSKSLDIAKKIFQAKSKRFKDFKPYTLHYGHIIDSKKAIIDDVLIAYMPAPNSFTGEDIIEINAHGGTTILIAILEELFKYGARQAKNGEFSKRAFLNGKIDLAQAEAIAEIISSPSLEGVKLANAKLNGLLGEKINQLRLELEHIRMLLCANLDFLDEDIDFLSNSEFLEKIQNIINEITKLCSCYNSSRIWQEGLSIVILGRVNAGKSSLMNKLLARNRAIVSDIAGTTRDYLEEQSYIHGLPVRIIDTAGLRTSHDPIENIGIEYSKSLANEADIVLYLIDNIQGLAQEDTEVIKNFAPEKCLIVWNKNDLNPEQNILNNYENIYISALTSAGLEELKNAIYNKANNNSSAYANEILPNKRQAAILEDAKKDLENILSDINNGLTYDILAVSIEEVAKKIGLITGIDAPSDVINSVFSNFCIGK